MSDFLDRRLSRRTALRWLSAAGLLPLVPVAACGPEGSSDGSTDAGDDGTTTADAGDDGTTTADAGGTTTTDAGTVAADDWATGGTAAMTAKASYPDPFTAAIASCAYVASTTDGPCTTSTNLVREDVSEGWTGLPLRLAIKVIDGDCNPVAGASVKIWHTNLAGSYSGQTPNPGMCLKSTAYASNDFFRGVQVTDANGVVAFDSCFPGWYRGRAVHIHFQVSVNGRSTQVSQLFFPEDVTAEIFTSHPEYKGYGQPDTTFSNDNIIGGIPSASRDRHILAVSRQSDGAMLAAKVVSVTTA